jgi:hypothetical protein
MNKYIDTDSLDELIIKEQGDENGRNIYNYICEESRRIDGFVNGVQVLDGDRMAYKELFYKCYNVIDKYLSENKQNKGFSWKKYVIALNLIKSENFNKMKIKMKDEIAFLINKTIDNFYEKNKEKIKNPNITYIFSIITYNVLNGFSDSDLEYLKKKRNDFCI